MSGVRAARRGAPVRPALAAVLVFAGTLAAPTARGFEFFDGRLQIHGFFEEQIRVLGEDLDPANDLDLAQWYHVLNVEIEGDIAPDGFGPLDLLSAYARFEVRYDCVWTRACGIFPSVDGAGDRINRIPRSPDATGARTGWSGDVFIGDQSSDEIVVDGQSFPGIPRGDLGRYTGRKNRPFIDPRQSDPGPDGVFGTPDDGALVFTSGLAFVNAERPATIDQLPGFSGLFVVAGPDQNFGAGRGPFGADDPAFFYFDRQAECDFGVRRTKGGNAGDGFQILGPLDPECEIRPRGALRNKPNPFSTIDPSPITGGVGGSELPARPAPAFLDGTLLGADQRVANTFAQGVYYPSTPYRRLLAKDAFVNPEQNFRQAEFEWNRGASQQDEKELKELYLDAELFDSRLWLRVGRQSIVWGKTELFRTTDQFNPQDLALASLPTLEESRIALWAARGVWSFYEVGPAEDVRLEVAFNYDQFEPADLGRCGEPFTALPVCNKTFALWLHGLTGFALAGEERPDDPWHGLENFEIGARTEFRLGRFSFQVSDFWGYSDFPHLEKITTYSRNVDPASGRPRKFGATGPCTTGAEAACLDTRSNIGADGDLLAGETDLVRPDVRAAALRDHPSNVQLFAMICATSIGFNNLDPSACGQSVFNSLNNFLSSAPPPNGRSDAKSIGWPSISSLVSNSLAGNTSAAGVVQFLAGAPPPFVRLNVDPCDAFRSDGCPAKGQAPVSDFGPHPFYAGTPTLSQVLTDEQEALLGCGAFWGTDCEIDGFDLLNAEAGVMLQSFVGAAGTYADPFTHSLVQPGPQPGTTAFDGVPGGQIYDRQTQSLVILPGARGPGDLGYDPNVDGTTTGLVTPPQFVSRGADQLQFRSEMAALSFNVQLLVAALSSAPDTGGTAAPDPPVEPDEFDVTNPFSTEPGQCSFAQPQFCGNPIALFDVSGLERKSVRAGGNGRFGRRSWVWQEAGEGVLRYEKRNVLGFSLDFAEDTTKSNWGLEATWIEGVQFTDNDAFDLRTQADTYNLTLSVDRPTFINFLNQNRTLFFNSQWFFQYVNGYEESFTTTGPFNVLGTFTIQTGYFQDRLLPAVTFVYDVESSSGASLPQITYRFTENFSATFGMNFFWGRFQLVDMPLSGIATLGEEVFKHAYRDGVENAVAVVRERDEIFLRIRYTF